MLFTEKCHVCGTKGRPWKKDPDVLKCPNCQSVFSMFGVILESEVETEDFWN